MTNGKCSIENLFYQVKMDDAGLIACKVGSTYIYIFLSHFNVVSLTLISCENSVLHTDCTQQLAAEHP
jgi:hypothetical protein